MKLSNVIALTCLVGACLLVLADSNAREKEIVFSTCTKDNNLVELQSRLKKSHSVAGSQRLIYRINEVTESCNILKEKRVSE